MAAWAQVVRDVCARTPPAQPEDTTFEDVPLFASQLPTNGQLTPALQAIAAVIDEEHPPRPEASRPSKRKAESLGEAQVCMALTGLGSAAMGTETRSPAQRQRVQAPDEATAMQP